jgi:hypothetical protein
MISVNEIGLSWEQELIEFSLIGLGITSALFQTFGIFPLFREVLNILVISQSSMDYALSMRKTIETQRNLIDHFLVKAENDGHAT